MRAFTLKTFGDVDFRMFFNLTQALEFFRNESDTLAEKIVYAFENDCRALEERVLPRLRKPFIVLEGNYRKSRNVVGMRLARLTHGRYLVHPATCLQHFASVLPRGTLFRRAFYILSMYALSFDVEFHLSLNRAVIVNGYWWDMLTFALVQAFAPGAEPPVSDPIYQIPRDLLPPDLVFFLDFPDNLYYHQVTTRSPRSWKPRIRKIYSQLQQQGKPVVMQELTGLYGTTTENIYGAILANLSSHRDVWFQPNLGINFDYRDQR